MSEIVKARELREAANRLEKARREVKSDTERIKRAVSNNVGIGRARIDLKYSTEELKRAQQAYDRLV